MRGTKWRIGGAAAIGVASVVVIASAIAVNNPNVKSRLKGFEEVPAISTAAGGQFEAKMTRNGPIRWELSYRGVPDVSQAHLHFAQKGVNGGIVVFLCTNLGNGPPGFDTLCPAGQAALEGTIDGDDVLEVASQGIAAGALGPLRRAVRAGVVYANVHTDAFPGGEIRGQLRFTP